MSQKAMESGSKISKDAATLQRMELRVLLDNLRKSIKFWFLAGKSLEVIKTSIVDILKHGLNIEKDWHTDETLKRNDVLSKFIDELVWLGRSLLIRDVDFCECADMPKSYKFFSSSQKTNITTLQQFLDNWTLRNLQEKTICASIQALVTEKEFLQNYYDTCAFFHNESYVIALGICLTAFELNQWSLISQIDENLFHVSYMVSDCVDGVKNSKHKRTSSYPNFSLSSLKHVQTTTEIQTSSVEEPTRLQNKTFKETEPKHEPVFPVFRKVKSFPTIPTFLNEDSRITERCSQRPRSKTMIIKTRPPPKPNLLEKLESAKQPTFKRKYEISTDCQISTSLNSKSSNSTNGSLSSMNISASPSNSTSSAETKSRQIKVINCDDIKVWTDQSMTESPSSKPIFENKYVPPSPVPIKKPKNISPINSFLSTLFGTPPTYSTWYSGETQFEQASQALDTQNSSSLNNNSNSVCNASSNSSAGGSIFDAFMPIYGQKVQLKPKNVNSLFEEGISTLDYKKSHSDSAKTNGKVKTEEVPSTSLRAGTSCQSLTVFLQNAHLSRNNTELEKENAHFRISEAIISAIEHMKCAKSQPRNRRESDAIVATDWLENERKNIDLKIIESQANIVQPEETILTEANENLPYAELSENRYETMSAEVVGLSLISKFNDQHLPKVSELKWLVSDEDTPQQLLPMPDCSPTANPDEHVLPTIIRGTRYWAPPRPQIIFTDHPFPGRKELIRKQNNRCAGCGMRVSQQNMSSFRYCTYFGKYHCTGCHRNQMSAIPAKILQVWDFKCYPVSVFAYRLLQQMYTFPLFHVPDLNPALYIKSKQLLEARNKRLKLKFIKDFVKACRYATREQGYFETIPDYIPNDPDLWSMSDFVDASNRSMHRSINEIIEKCENHIFHCLLCTGRGFCCEYCVSKKEIFPWSNKVFRCDCCGSCFHLNCWKAMREVCCRCQRIRNRQSEIAESICNEK